MLKRIENSLKMLEKPVKLSVIVAIIGSIIFAMAIVSNISTGAAPTISPLDVNVTNTPNVSVVNTPTVNIGAGSVGITGTPNVNVANTITNPVPIRDVDNPARQPFQIRLHLDIPDGVANTPDNFIVPSGKQLIIEFASAKGILPSGEKIGYEISTPPVPPLNATPYWELIPNFVGTFSTSQGNFDIIVASQQMRIYLDSGSMVTLNAYRNSFSGEAGVDFSVSGYLVNTS